MKLLRLPHPSLCPVEGGSGGTSRELYNWMQQVSLILTEYGAIDHGALGGLTDDDHTQYALLAGRGSDVYTFKDSGNVERGYISTEGLDVGIPDGFLKLRGESGVGLSVGGVVVALIAGTYVYFYKSTYLEDLSPSQRVETDSNKKLVSKANASAQADSTAASLADLVTDFNALLAKLRAAGLMAP